MHKFSRIAHNSANWQRPTGEAKEAESAKTFNGQYGFGYEDWLFRSEWLIDGWRYAFIQGVNKSHAKLVKAGCPIDITLFTIQPDKKRRLVATILDVECIDDQHAQEGVAEFKKRGWFGLMEQEVHAVKGDVSALHQSNYANHVLNVRFRLENVRLFPTGSYVQDNDPIMTLNRYQLYDNVEAETAGIPSINAGRAGLSSLPCAESFQRRGTAPIECTPDHARMQAKLMQELQAEHPNAEVLREKDFIDVSVRTASELLLFEIKPDLEPRTVIRQALGQILEYAFHPHQHHSLPVRLFIVGRHASSKEDNDYLKILQKDFGLPIEYRKVSL